MSDQRRTNNKISVEFTYDVPDDYLYLTNDLGKTGIWTYDGPDKCWVLVDKATNRFVSVKTEADDGDVYPVPPNIEKVFVNCQDNPLFCTIIGLDEIRDYSDLPQYEEQLPDGNVYSRPAVPAPDHTYELQDIAYNPITKEFVKPYPWKKPHVTWNDIRAWRNSWLAYHDSKNVDDMPPALRTQWEEFRQKLRDIPQTYGAEPGGTPIIDPWKFVPPVAPDGTF
jgi:hypothetical protein